MTLSPGEYAIGLADLVLVLGCSAAIASLAVRRRAPHLDGVPQVIGFGVLATVALIAVHLIPAIIGVLSREAVAVTAVLLAFGATAIPVATKNGDDDSETWPASRFPESKLSQRFAIAAGGLVSLYLLGVVLAVGPTPPANIDTLTFHLPGVASWINSGSIWQIDQFVPDQAHGYYPNNGNLVELAAVLPFRSDFLIRLVGLPFLALTAVAVYGIARELRAPGSAAALAGALAVSIPVVTRPAIGSPLPDSIMLAGLAAGAFFLLRHQREGKQADLLIAGLAIGLAFGTKWYGVSSAIIVIAIWAAARLWCGRPATLVVRETGILTGLVLLMGGIWLLRNAIESGNPVFPLEVGIAGLTIFDAPRDEIRELYGSSISDYFTDSSVWSDGIIRPWREFLAFPGILAALAVPASLLTASFVRERRSRPVIAVGVAAAALALVYAITPYSALGLEGQPTGVGPNSRYAVPAALFGCAAFGWLIGASGVLRRVLELAALVAVLQGLGKGTPVGSKYWLAGLVGVLALAGLYLVGRWLVREGRVRLAVAGAVCLAIAAIAAGWGLQQRFNENRYTGADEALTSFTEEYDEGQRIGLSGFWDLTRIQPVLPAFGPRLENEVFYMGDLEEGMLRPAEDSAEFGAAVGRLNPDLILVGKEPVPTRADLPEDQWAREAGFRIVIDTDRFTLFADGGE